METMLNLTIYGHSKDEAVDILADVLLMIEKHSFKHPNDNDCGLWLFNWSNLPSETDLNDQEEA